MNQWIDALACLHFRSLWHILKAQLVEVRVLRERCAFQVEEIVRVQADSSEHVTGLQESAAEDEGGGGELGHLGRGHKRPRLHPETGFYGPVRAVEGEVNDGIRALQSAIASKVERGFATKAIWPVPGRLG